MRACSRSGCPRTRPLGSRRVSALSSLSRRQEWRPLLSTRVTNCTAGPSKWMSPKPSAKWSGRAHWRPRWTSRRRRHAARRPHPNRGLLPPAATARRGGGTRSETTRGAEAGAAGEIHHESETGGAGMGSPSIGAGAITVGRDGGGGGIAPGLPVTAAVTMAGGADATQLATLLQTTSWTGDVPVTRSGGVETAVGAAPRGRTAAAVGLAVVQAGAPAQRV